MLHALRRKALNAFRQPLFTLLWFPPLWILLGLAKAVIFRVSFRRLATCLGASLGVACWVPLLAPYQEARAVQITQAVRFAARHTPWNSNCFPQAVAARVLLGVYRIPYVLCFGLARDLETREMNAHAWVVAGSVPVTGGDGFTHFTVVGCFVAPWLDVSASDGGRVS